MSPSISNGNSMTPHINPLISPVLSYTMLSVYHSATVLCIKLPSHPQDFSSNLINERHDSLIDKHQHMHFFTQHYISLEC